MVSAASLKDQMDGRVREIRDAVGNVSEEQAAAKPSADVWSVKEVLSHLSGRDTQDFLAGLKRFLTEDEPDLGLTPGESYFDGREKLPVKDLLVRVDTEYSEIAQFLGGLSDEQLARKGFIPFLKETPLTDHPTLAGWATAIINFHLPDHINQLKTLCK